MEHLTKTRNLAETKLEDNDSVNLEDTLETFWKFCKKLG